MPDFITAADGCRIAYQLDRGATDAPALAFVHGAGGDRFAWKDELQTLNERGFTTLAFDLRGHGESDRPASADAYALTAFADDLAAILDAEELHRPVVIGHSFGGAVVTAYHARHGAKSAGYVLIDSLDRAPALLHQLFHNHPWVHALIARVPQFQTKVPVASHHEQYKGTGDWYIPRILEDIRETSLRSWLLTYEQLGEFSGIEILHQIQQPVLVIQGDEDTVVHPSVAHRLQGEIPHATLQLLAGQNHILVLNDPDDISASIGQFANQLFT